MGFVSANIHFFQKSIRILLISACWGFCGFGPTRGGRGRPRSRERYRRMFTERLAVFSFHWSALVSILMPEASTFAWAKV